MNDLLATLLIACVLILGPAPSQGQQLDYNKQAEFDAEGNIYVSSDQNKLIWMGTTKRCSEAYVANDQQTVGCSVMQDPELGNTVPSLRLEIYRRGGTKQILEPGSPILDWHFWKDGEQVVLYYGPGVGQGTYALYDSATARVIEKLAEPSDQSMLPQWAKNQQQIQDESVPMSAALSEERTKWISKILGQIAKIQPGMTRKDLLKLLTTEGGLSTRTQRTYVLTECPNIKVTVHFKPANGENDLNEDPDDIIESISQPFLAWSVMD